MYFRSIAVAVAAATLSSAQSSPPSLTDALSSTSDLSTLNTILGAYPDLVSILANSTNITIFAPNNAAFEAVTPALQALNSSDTGAIPAILEYHVLNATVFSQNITSTPTFAHTILTNATYANVTGGQVVGVRTLSNGTVSILSGLGQTSQVITADVAIANGVVHIIDNVLTLPVSDAETALAGELTAFAGALTATNLLDTVDGLSDVTIFAPTNAAFEAIGSALSTLSTNETASILEYHVLNGTVAYSSLIANGTSRPSITGQNLNFTIEDGELFVDSARVISADILVANGVIHLIDAVLNPNSTQAPNPDESSAVPAYSGASSAPLAFTSGITPTTTVAALASTTDAVVDGYTPVSTDVLPSVSSSLAAASSSTAGAPMRTAAVGAAALFGGAAFIANM